MPSLKKHKMSDISDKKHSIYRLYSRLSWLSLYPRIAPMLQAMPKAEFNGLGDADGHLGAWHTAAQRDGGAFAPGLVPQAAVDERLEGGRTAFDHQRTNAAAVEGHKEGVDVGIGFEAGGQLALRHTA